MILLETHQMYYNTQVYFREHHLDQLPHDDKIWAREYARWLAGQGAVIVRPAMFDFYIKNSLGISPGYDKFGFERAEDAVQFTLRWS